MTERLPCGGVPRISIVIATYNYAHYLPIAIRSVQAQTVSDWECIVVDDASTDDTSSVCSRLLRDDSRFRYIRNATNQGEAGARNTGNDAARGEFIASLDADDWWEPEKLRLQCEAIDESPGTVLSFMPRIVQPVRQSKYQETMRHWAKNLDYGLRRRNSILHSSVMVSREALQSVGGYDECLPYAVDWDLWLRILRRFGSDHFLYLDKPLVHYRIHARNMSNDWRKFISGTRKVALRYLLRDSWFLRHPFLTCGVVQEQTVREYKLVRGAIGGMVRRRLRSKSSLSIPNP